jgi:hypothetical protein
MQLDLPAPDYLTYPGWQPECPVCFGPHNDEIHDASLSIRSWFRADIQRRMERPADIEGLPFPA